MRLAIFKTMWWSLARDRGALLMSFVLPPLVFVIFASIFSSTSSGDLEIELAVVDQRDDADSRRLLRVLEQTEGVRFVSPGPSDAQQVRAAVRDGRADAGLVVRDNQTRFDNLDPAAEAPILLLANPSREIAMTGLQGALQAAYFAALPEAVIGAVARVIDTRLVPFSVEQRGALEQTLQAMAARVASDTGTDDTAGMIRFDAISERQDVFENAGAPLAVSYYAGAVAILFLLFSSMTSASTLIDERDSGLLQRLSSGPGGAGVVVDGKFLFMVLQGLVQIALIFAVAWWLFDVRPGDRFGTWLATSVLAAICASGLALLFVSLCRSRQQAHSLGNFVVLVMSALGGSMIPRFLMPVEVRDLGWLTPNTWVLEGYASALWQPTTSTPLLPLGALAASGVLGLLIARLLTARRARA
ncbi:MAG: ABC transporter permease [Gammaproteobacteria bacterium]|nr:ABC transporter permease [Gammaproteobacteria bacterium]